MDVYVEEHTRTGPGTSGVDPEHMTGSRVRANREGRSEGMPVFLTFLVRVSLLWLFLDKGDALAHRL